MPFRSTLPLQREAQQAQRLWKACPSVIHPREKQTLTQPVAVSRASQVAKNATLDTATGCVLTRLREGE